MAGRREGEAEGKEEGVVVVGVQEGGTGREERVVVVGVQKGGAGVQRIVARRGKV